MDFILRLMDLILKMTDFIQQQQQQQPPPPPPTADLLHKTVTRSVSWLLANQYPADHPDKNLAGSFLELDFRHKAYYLGPHSRAVIHRDLGTSFALPALGQYDSFCASGAAAAAVVCGESYAVTPAADVAPTCPRFLAAPPDDGAGAAASLNCFVQPTCGACVATDPAKSLCGWCAEYCELQ